MVASVDPRMLRQLEADGVLSLVGTYGVVSGDHRVGAAVERAISDARAWIESADPD